MSKKFVRGLSLGFLSLFLQSPLAHAGSMVFFDFDEIPLSSKKSLAAPAIEAYMEELYGSDISVSQKTVVARGRSINSSNSLNNLSAQSAGDAYLTLGKGKGLPAITLDFGASPIDSFSVDFQLFKKAKNLSILADGVLINRQTLTKAQRKKGLTGHLLFFFDSPVETLQFVGSKKKSIGIDNLLVNIAHDLNSDNDVDGDEAGVFLNGPVGNLPFDDPTTEQLGGPEFDSINQVPEPASLLLLAVGLCGAWLVRRSAQTARERRTFAPALPTRPKRD